MSYFSIPLDEQETTITFRRTDKDADIWTNDRTMITKLDRLCEKSPDNYKCIDVNRYIMDDEDVIVDKKYRISDKTLISFRSAKIRRDLTDEQKKEMAERLRGSKFV